MARDNTDPSVFWREYEEKCGEKVLAYGLGRYLGGWDGYPMPLWGLIIATEGSFRFQHFPNESWFAVIRKSARQEEKSFAIKRDDIISFVYWKEKKILKRIFFSTRPCFIIQYKKPDGSNGEVRLEVDEKGESIAAFFGSPGNTSL